MTVKSNLRIVFAGTPDFAATVLATLVSSRHDVVAAYTQPDRPAGRGRKKKGGPVKILALRHELPVHQPNSFDEAQAAVLGEYRADVMVVAAYGLLLPPSVLELPRWGCINVHASLLPRWRGAAPIQRAILAGDVETGVTIMQMDRGLDTGDMLGSRVCAITECETAASVHDRLADLGAQALLDVLEQLCCNELSPRPQDASQSTYAARLHKQEARICWSDSAVALAAKVRGFNPWPIAFTEIGGQRLRIWSAQALSTETHLPPGTIVAAQASGIDVATGVGLLRVAQVQLPGGRSISAADFINARGVLVGTCLGSA